MKNPRGEPVLRLSNLPAPTMWHLELHFHITTLFFNYQTWQCQCDPHNIGKVWKVVSCSQAVCSHSLPGGRYYQLQQTHYQSGHGLADGKGNPAYRGTASPASVHVYPVIYRIAGKFGGLAVYITSQIEIHQNFLLAYTYGNSVPNHQI